MILGLQVQAVLAYIGAVSLLLVFIWLGVRVYRVTLGETPSGGEKVNPSGITVVQPEVHGEDEVEEELVAVLAAAAYVARRRWQHPVAIRAVTRLAGSGLVVEPTPAWAMAGRLEMSNPRRRR